MTQWRHIEALISEPGPFIWRNDFRFPMRKDEFEILLRRRD